MNPRNFILVCLALIIGALAWSFWSDEHATAPELPGTMTQIAKVSGAIAVWHLQYKGRHYLVTSKGGIMILPRWIEGSAKVAPPLEKLGTRRHGSEPTIEDLTSPGTVITGEIK